jgi:transcriptional regulator GlxA family with amidase domain
MFMLFPGEWHRYMPALSTGWEEYWISFKGELAEQLIKDFPFSRNTPVLHTAGANTLFDEFLHIAEEFEHARIGYEKILAARLLLMLTNVAVFSLRSNLEGTSTIAIVDQARALMNENVKNGIGIEEIANRLGVGYSWFRREFRAYTGFSPGQYFQQLRLNRAKDLLDGTTLSVAQIGNQCGFDSAYNFSYLFKKKTGKTPSEYRANPR